MTLEWGEVLRRDCCDAFERLDAEADERVWNCRHRGKKMMAVV